MSTPAHMPGHLAYLGGSLSLEFKREGICSECKATFIGNPTQETCGKECSRRRKARIRARRERQSSSWKRIVHGASIAPKISE